MGPVNNLSRGRDNGRRAYLDREAERGLGGGEWLNRRETAKDKALCNLTGMFYLSQRKRGRNYINQSGLGCAAVMTIPKELNTLRLISPSHYLVSVSLCQVANHSKIYWLRTTHIDSFPGFCGLSEWFFWWLPVQVGLDGLRWPYAHAWDSWGLSLRVPLPLGG